jgi:methylated-DNA-[protein]-cysteine S-methyltransferase
MLINSPVGLLTIVSGPRGLEAIRFGRCAPAGVEPGPGPEHPVSIQLNEYFAGVRRSFDLEIAPAGTPFQQRVWRELTRIPWGETRSYRDIAVAVGRRGAARAVGMANNRNPLPIVIPCHRVIGADGSLTGYAGGLQTKAWLLALEGALPPTRGYAATSHSRGRSTEFATAP